MKVKTFLKLIVSLGLSLASAIFVPEMYIRFYVYSSGTTRAAHSDEYGMAFYSLVIAAITFCVVAILCMAYFAKRLSQKIGGKHDIS